MKLLAKVNKKNLLISYFLFNNNTRERRVRPRLRCVRGRRWYRTERVELSQRAHKERERERWRWVVYRAEKSKRERITRGSPLVSKRDREASQSERQRGSCHVPLLCCQVRAIACIFAYNVLYTLKVRESKKHPRTTNHRRSSNLDWSLSLFLSRLLLLRAILYTSNV